MEYIILTHHNTKQERLTYTTDIENTVLCFPKYKIDVGHSSTVMGFALYYKSNKTA